MGFWQKLWGSKNSIVVQNVKQSKVSITQWFIAPTFKVKESWFQKLLEVNYDHEIESKFIPELHQDHQFHRDQLVDILDFKTWTSRGAWLIDDTLVGLDRFEEKQKEFYQLLEAEDISITNNDDPLISSAKKLEKSTIDIRKELTAIKVILSLTGYSSLTNKAQVRSVNCPLTGKLKRKRNDWNKVLSKPPNDNFLLQEHSSVLDQVFDKFVRLNRWLDEFSIRTSYKIIAGKAGTGKTHTSAHLVREIKNNKDEVIFLKAKMFSGDNVSFPERFTELLGLPLGLHLEKVLETLDKYAKTKKKRVFFIIDALNETTTSNLGFSPIWHQELQRFTTLVSQYSSLYLITTLRTSYVDSIWNVRPRLIAELHGFDISNIREACSKYFRYYKIKVTNPDADLKYFSIPLLLDLFCKLLNENRQNEVETSLGLTGYKTVFQGYVSRLIEEVKRKRNLAMAKPIIDGLGLSSDRFLSNIGGILDLDEFTSSFDPDPHTKEENSIAKSVLEGYLLFIKDKISNGNEIVKHTQQEVGGYLIATRLIEIYPTAKELITSKEFQQKLVGTDTSLHHQLRLDIIKFLIASCPEIIPSVVDTDSLSLGWWYLYNGYDGTNPDVPSYLVEHSDSLEIIEEVLRTSEKGWFDASTNYNFIFISEFLGRLKHWDFDLAWSFFIYKNAEGIFRRVEYSILRLDKPDIKVSEERVFARFIAMVTSTSIRELRDLATKYLVKFGTLYPVELLDLAEFCSSKDSYIYERVVQSIYGVLMIKQHDKEYINKFLPEIALRLFNLQFSSEATTPVFNYIVIDSIKHVVDLAILNGLWQGSEQDLNNVSKFISPKLSEWMPPTDEQMELIAGSDEMSWPEPIGMDFGIYTVPRLVDNDAYEFTRPAIANVYKRIFELGYLNYEQAGQKDEQFNDFFYGTSLSNRNGKVDKLGKKYNWKSFFDYAGILLQRGELNSYQAAGDPESGFQRLSDVDIDISMPSKNYKISKRIYPLNLMDQRENNNLWNTEVKIDSLSPYFVYSFDGVPYVMLKGVVEQRVDDGYKVRSFIMAETIFIKKNENYKELKNEVCNHVFNWDRDLHLSAETVTRAYYGEFYWADNQIERSEDYVSIRTGKTIKRKRTIELQHALQLGDDFKDVGKEIEETIETSLQFEGEQTLIQYLWESDSEILSGFAQYIPTVKMGKHLGLKADPASGRILDSDLRECLQTVEFDQSYFRNEFTYLRADLLKSYLVRNDLGLLYQTKQHSYDLNANHSRFMKYFVVDDI